MHQDNQNQLHRPVLLDPVLAYLDPREGDSYLDLTGGYGGHAAAVLERTHNPKGSVLVDRDHNAIAELEKRFAGQGITLINRDFYSASEQLREEGRTFDLILADLGVSSPHLNQASRGFSLKSDGPLDMRMDQTQSLTAEMVVNTYSAEELADILKRYGEEPKAKQIASLIVNSRPITTTGQLAAIVAKAWPGRSKVHPATRTFQALRIVVNDELELLRKSLPVWMDELLAPGGRIAVISFHSLEDRIVKQAFAEKAGDRYDALFRLLTKKPVVGDDVEIVSNPRARSAKLRAAAKQK
ncbi:MAG TPA: 16S rRNA (cytosine(1402)-N(4))-methyltransferase RsmH [Candidatus Saccharimonadales bacterium]